MEMLIKITRCIYLLHNVACSQFHRIYVISVKLVYNAFMYQNISLVCILLKIAGDVNGYFG